MAEREQIERLRALVAVEAVIVDERRWEVELTGRRCGLDALRVGLVGEQAGVLVDAGRGWPDAGDAEQPVDDGGDPCGPR